MKIRICHLYPETLNLYGDRGNVLCMRKRLEWRGIDCEVDSLSIGETKDLSGFDLFFMGGGQDFEQEVLLEDLHRGRDKELIAAAEDGMTILAICGGYQMLGAYYETHDGKRCDFVGALDLYTVGAKTRMIGNYMYQVDENSAALRWWALKTTAARPGSARASSLWEESSRASATTVRTAWKAHITTMSSAPTATARCCRRTLRLPTF